MPTTNVSTFKSGSECGYQLKARAHHSSSAKRSKARSCTMSAKARATRTPARRFKKILFRAEQQTSGASGRVDAAAAELKKEALEDLALTFSESGGAKEAYRFMKQVGGEEYSIRVLSSLGDVFFRQARYLKAVDSYRMLVDRFPLSVESPEHRVRIANAYERAGLMEKAGALVWLDIATRLFVKAISVPVRAVRPTPTLA